eukprot:7291723-Heterocapsa_arctica.AAC.1
MTIVFLFTPPQLLLEPSWHPSDLYLSSRSLECCTQQLGAPALTTHHDRSKIPQLARWSDES